MRALALLLAASAASARPHVTIDARVDARARTVEGRAAIEIANDSRAPLGEILLWRFPARLARRPAGLNDYNFYWVYPRSFSPGGMTIGRVTVDGAAAAPALADADPAGPGTLVRVPLARPLAPGARARVEVEFSTKIPARFGGFGCFGDACTLAGGFYPMPVALGAGGWDLTAPPARADLDVAVAAPGHDVLVNGRAATGARVHLDDAAYAVVRTDRGLRERALTQRGVTFRYHHHGADPPPPTPPGKAAPYLDEDRAQLVLDAAREAVELLAELGWELPDGETLDLVEAPLRLELAEPHGGCVLVSDQIFRILPAERFRKFHAFQLVRAIFAVLVEKRLAAREDAADLGWSPDVAASYLVDQYTLREYRKSEFARDVLAWVAFIPTIDRILYAPQVPFATAYFNTLEDPDPTRDAMPRFANRRPRGKLIYEKLRDRLGDDGAAKMAHALWQGTPLREAAPLGADFYAMWLGAYPEVDYRFEVLGRERVGEKWRYRIRVWKRGEKPPVEPVEVRATEWGGARHDLEWDGQGRETVLTVEVERGLRSIELDPRGRLVEQIAGDNDDLRLDDRSPKPVKFIYNNFGGLINFQTLSLDLSLDFTLARIYDVKNAVRFLLYHSEATQIGLLTAYGRGFGPKVTPSHLAGGASLSLNVARLQEDFGLGGTNRVEPGTRISVAAAVGWDDRLYIWEPLRANTFALGVTYSLTALDAGDVLQQLTVSGTAQRIQPLADGHGLAGEIGAAATFGLGANDLRVPSQMLVAGAPSWLRGYEPDELLGRLRLTAKLEYRHVFLHDLDWNLLHVLYLRGIAGAVFTEAAAISPCSGYSIGANDLFADVGYSLRFLADWFGVSQTVFNVDVAAPLWRRRRDCFGSSVDPAARAPVGVFIYFGPVW